MDLSKAFDYTPHDLLIAKLHVYGLTTEALTFLYSYLNRRLQGVIINDAENIFEILLSGVPQSSILGPTFLNIFIIDWLLFINKATLANFADNNTVYANITEMETLLDILEKESETAIKWFKKMTWLLLQINFKLWFWVDITKKKLLIRQSIEQK